MKPAVRLTPFLAVLLALRTAAAAPALAGEEPPAEEDLFLKPPPPPIPPPPLPPLPLPVSDDDTPAPGRSLPRVTYLESLAPGDGTRRKLENNTKGQDGLLLKSEVIFRAPEPTRETPFERGQWSTEDELHVPVTGPIFLFGKLDMVGEYSADQDMKVVGRTGVLYKLPLGPGREAQLRGGPAVRYVDVFDPERESTNSEVWLELHAKWPVLGTMRVEYTGAASPSVASLDAAQVKQDLGLTIPVSGGKFKFGARHRWESLQEARPWTGNAELYLGIELAR